MTLGKKVLVAAPSNDTTDVIAERLSRVLGDGIVLRCPNLHTEIFRSRGQWQPHGIPPGPHGRTQAVTYGHTAHVPHITHRRHFVKKNDLSSNIPNGDSASEGKEPWYAEPIREWLGSRSEAELRKEALIYSLYERLLEWVQQSQASLQGEDAVVEGLDDYEDFEFAMRSVLIEKLNTFKVIVTTCANAGDSSLHQVLDPDVVIIDEAAFAHELEVFPILFHYLESTKLVVLIGDYHQMAPVVRSVTKQRDDGMWQNPFDLQLLYSLMERLEDAGYPTASLTENQRMVAGLAKPMSDIFYDSKVIDHPDVALESEQRSLARSALRFFNNELGMNLETPALLLSVSNGVCMEDKESHSKRNQHNIAAVLKFISHFLGTNSD